VNVFNLVEQTTSTLNFENRKNIKRCVFSNNGLFLITVDVEGHALFINFPNKIVLHRFHFKRKVYDIKFSPDDLFFVVTFGHGVQIWRSPNTRREFVPLALKRILTGHFDDTTCVDWSSDGRSIVMGSKDLTIRVYMNVRSKFMSLHKLSGHRDRLIGVYFSADNQTVYSVARDGALFTWKLEQQSPVGGTGTVGTSSKVKTHHQDYEGEDEDDDDDGDNHSDSEDSFLEDGDDDDEDDESDDDSSNDTVDSDEPQLRAIKRKRASKPPPKTKYTHSANRGKWILANREFLWDHNYFVTSTAFHKKSNLLVVGFNNGVFSLYELPNCVSIQRISISNASISTVGINNTGEWLVLGSASLSQLLIWEWKSESYILKQQGHLYGMNGVDFSNDGMFIATAGEDAKVKIWSAVSGFCVVTFTEHIAPVTGVKFIGKGTAKAILSCSLDGTVRAHDLLRYKNFRTLTTATPVQFTSVASDPSGEVVCAGSLDPFQIYVWSLQSGHLLEVLAGHEGPTACLEFTATGGLLLSGSWDGTLKVWDVYKNECVDTMEHGCDVLSVSIRPDGKEACTCATNGKNDFIKYLYIY